MHRSRGTRISGGSGPTVVQLSDSDLPDAPPDLPVRVVTAAPRGAGQDGIAGALADLEELRASLGLSHWAVIGHARGADLGLAYAAEHPLAVERLVSVCGSGLHEADPGADDGWQHWIRTPDLFRKLAGVREPVFVRAELDDRPSWPIAQLAGLYGGELHVVPGVGPDLWRTHPERWTELALLAAGPHATEPEPDPVEQARARLEVLDPLVSALADARGIVELLLDTEDDDAARAALAARGLSEIGVAATLDLQLRRLTREQRDRLRQQQAELRRLVADAPGT